MKKLFMRWISFVLIATFALQCGIFDAYAAPANSNTTKQVQESKEKQDEKPEKERPKGKKVVTEKPHKIPNGLAKKTDRFEKWKGKKESIENRTSYSKTYQNENGTKTSVIFLEPIHTKDSSGRYIDIDNSLIQTREKDGLIWYKNKTGIYDVFFSSQKDAVQLQIKKDKLTIEITPQDITTKDMVVEDSQVLYQGKDRGVEYLYTVMNSGIKENIILKHYIDKFTYTYELDIKGFAEPVLENGVINIKNKLTGETYFTLSAPIMIDGDGNENRNLTLGLKNEKGKHIVTLSVDKAWLKDPARVYPVMIDPTVTLINDGEFYDTYVQQRDDTNQFDAEMIYVGYDDGEASQNIKLYGRWKERTRGYIKLIFPPEITPDLSINSATLNLYKYTAWSSTPRNVQLFNVMGQFSTRTVTWANQPAVEGPISSIAINGGTGWYSWDIKSVIQGMIAGSGQGMSLRLENEDTQADCFESTQTFRGHPPYIEINYRDGATPTPTPTPRPTFPPQTGELELVLERNDILENGVAYAKSMLEWDGEKNRATISYKLMPDGTSGEVTEENFTSLDWETQHFSLQPDKVYWIEAEIKVEEWIQPEPILDEEGNVIEEPPGYYEEVLTKSMSTDKFIVCESQPGDTLKRLAKHYLNSGSSSTEIMQLNKLQNEALTVGQKLFVMTEKEKPYNYKQPNKVTAEMELKDAPLSTQPLNTEFTGQYINPHTGGFIYSTSDFSYTVYKMDMRFTRSYNSLLENRKSPLGDKWDYSFNKYLFFYKDGAIGYNTGDGSRVYFRKNGSSYATTAPTYDSLTDTGAYYEIKTRENIRYIFSKTGLLTAIKDANNNQTIVTYNENDWQTQIKDATNRTVDFQYHDGDEWSGNICEIRIPGSTTLKFNYQSGTNNLSRYTDGEGYTTTYTYDSKAQLETVTLPEGNTIIRNTYRNDGKVQTQYDGENNSIILDYQSSKTVVKDGRGYNTGYSYNSNLWMTRKDYPDNKYETFNYDSKGNMTQKTDRRQQTHSYTYNELGYNTLYTRPDNKSMTYRYKSGYLLEYTKDFEGNETETIYDSNNNTDMIKEYYIQDGVRKASVTDYTYDSKGLLLGIKDPDGVESYVDNSGYPSKQVIKDENNNAHTYYYDSMGRDIAIVDPKGNQTRNTYDKNGNILETLYPATGMVRSISYTYDKNSNLKSQTGSRIIPDGDGYATTLYNYDDNDRLMSITDPYNHTITYGYDINGNIDWEKDVENNLTYYQYNSLNLITGVIYPGQQTSGVTYEYDALGNIKKQIEADGNWIEYTYDYGINRVTTVSRPQGCNVSYEYDSMGNVKKMVLADRNYIEYEYDGLYRMKKITEPGNKVTEVEYLNSGRIWKIKENGRTFTYEYYPQGKLKRATESFEDIYNIINPYAAAMSSMSLSAPTSRTVAYTVEYTYDENGNIETIKDEEGKITRYTYNEINKVSKVVDPMNKTRELKYDEDGNVYQATDGEGNVKQIQYDGLNRVYTVNIPAENTTYTYLYNSRGMLESSIDPMGNPTTHYYDPMGRLVETINAKQEKTSYEYYTDGTLKKITYPNNQSEEYRYDSLNRPIWTKDRAGIERSMSYTVTGQLDLETDSVGNSTDYTYDALGRLQEIKDILGRTKTFTYDTLGKVETVKGMDGSTITYRYDPKGRVRETVDPEGKITSMSYNGDNKVTAIAKPGGRIYSYQYDDSGNLWKVTDPAGSTTEYQYNGDNLVKEIINPRGYSKRYTYSALNKVETMTNERGYATTYDYYPGGHLKEIKDAKDNRTEYAYDALNRIETIANALNETTTYTYDPIGNVKTVKDARGVTTTYAYTPKDQVEYTYDTQNNTKRNMYYPNGDLWKTIDEENNVTEYKYDAAHRLVKLIESGGYTKNFVYDLITGDIQKMYDNEGKTITYAYDKMHRLLSEIDNQGGTTSYTYDDFGNLHTKTTPDGNTTTYSYDELDRITGILDPENNLTQLSYDPVGNIDYIIKPGGMKYDYSYDAANNVERVVDSLGQETVYTYDGNNSLSTMKDPLGNTLIYEFDALNRLKTISNPTGIASRYHYDKSGNVDRIIDGNGGVTDYLYNNLNRLEMVKDAEGNITRYTYYKDGKLKTMTDGRGNTSTYTYNPAGQLEKFTNPSGEVKQFEYTLSGKLDNMTKPDGSMIDYVYDNQNRLEKILYPDSTFVKYTYDSLDRKTSMEDKNGVTNYAYDQMGRLTWVQDAAGEEVSYEYDEKGRKTSVIYPDGKYVDYEYDEYDRLITVIDRDGRITRYAYDEAGRRKTTELPNGITTTYAYDTANRVTEITSTKQDGSIVSKFAYTYDGVGNKTGEEIWEEDKHYKREYAYYKNNTIKSMTETGDNSAFYSYTYDGAGNITAKTVTEKGITKEYTYTYNEANRMVTEACSDGETRAYRYDENGNRTERVIDVEETEEGSKEVVDYFYYDPEDRLEEIVEHNGKVHTYGYDGEGNRLWRTYSQYPMVKPPVEEDERVKDPAEFPGWNKNDNKGKGKAENSEEINSQSLRSIRLSVNMPVYRYEKKDDGRGNSNGGGNSGGNGNNGNNGNSGNSGNNGNSGGNSNNSSNGNGGSKDSSSANEKADSSNNGKGKEHIKGNIDTEKAKGKTKEHTNKGQDKEDNGKAKGKEKVKTNRGRHLGWYKRKDHPKNPDGIDLNNPEVFQVTNYINDVSTPLTQVLMTTDVDGNYRGVYTYGKERISVEDLVSVEGVPNNPLYYLYNALGTTTAITNMNAEVIDSNRFAPYGEPLDPVAKNSRLTNSNFGFTGEIHDIEAGLVYLRARYYEPRTARFIQQDSLLGDVKEPLSRNLYGYAKANPLTYVDPTGHEESIGENEYGRSILYNSYTGNVRNLFNEPNKGMGNTYFDDDDVASNGYKNDLIESIGLGIMSSLVQNGFDSINLTSDIFYQTLTIMGLPSSIANQIHVNFAQKKEDILAEIESKIKNPGGYYAGRTITDIALVATGLGGVKAGTTLIEAGITGDVASGLLEVLSLGSLSEVVAVTAVVGAVAVAVGAAVTTASASLAVTSGASLIDDTGKLINSGSSGSNSLKLRKNMIKAGVQEPDYPNAAHHIVPATAKEAETARTILENCGIDDINDVANGVFLPTKAGHGVATIHKGRHTNEYIKEVTDRLIRANPTTRAHAEAVLNTIRHDLLNGSLGL